MPGFFPRGAPGGPPYRPPPPGGTVPFPGGGGEKTGGGAPPAQPGGLGPFWLKGPQKLYPGKGGKAPFLAPSPKPPKNNPFLGAQTPNLGGKNFPFDGAQARHYLGPGGPPFSFPPPKFYM